MAQSLTLSRPRVASFLSIACIFFASTVYGQNLIDPTRPPASILKMENGVELPSAPVLQAVLLAPNRKIATIDGQMVKLNGRFGDQILIKLTETEAVLRRGKMKTVLRLFPDFEKKPVLENPQISSKISSNISSKIARPSRIEKVEK